MVNRILFFRGKENGSVKKNKRKEKIQLVATQVSILMFLVSKYIFQLFFYLKVSR